MKKTLFLSLILSCLCGFSAQGAYTLDNAAGYTYYDSATSSWASNNITKTVAADGSMTLTTGQGSYGNGYDIAVAITLDVSKLGADVSGNQHVFQMGSGSHKWGLGVKEDGTIVGTWDNNFGYPSTLSVNGRGGFLTLVMTMDSSEGTTFMDETMKGGDSSGLKGGVLSTNTLTISSYAANALVGIATWNTTANSDVAKRLEAYNALAGAIGNAEIEARPASYVKGRSDGTSLGRVMFMGDSITHGYDDASYRWQFFKILVDNGLEFELSGPRAGLWSDPNTSDFTVGSASYGAVEYADVHYARSSGRTYNMLTGLPGTDPFGRTGRGVPYEYPFGGVVSVAGADTLTNADTHILLMGTNDLLSDTASGTTGEQYATVMQSLLGGTVSYRDNTYTREKGDSMGNMGQIADAVLKEDTDTMYILSVPVWGTGNNNHRENSSSLAFEAVRQYNGLLESWVSEYNETATGKAHYVDINRGLLDVTKQKWIGCDAFFRTSGGDYLHPNEQGSLIIAGNLAKGMGLAGRTAGQHRKGSADFSHQVGSVSVGSGTPYTASNCFGAGEAYTLSFDLRFGNGATDGWSSSDAFTIASGNGTVSGTLSISEGFIKWGTQTLFSLDMSQNTETLRIAYLQEDISTGNTAGGYYVWLGDMLIGQALAVTTGDSVVNGLSLTTTLSSTQVENLAYDTGSYAPLSGGLASEENAYYAVSGEIDPDTVKGEPIEWQSTFEDASEAVGTTYVYAVDPSSASEGDIAAQTTRGTASWYGAMGNNSTTDNNNLDHDGDVALLVQAENSGSSLLGTLFGVVNAGTVTGDVTVVMNSPNATVGAFTGRGGAIVGAFKGTIDGKFTAVWEAGTTEKDIIGGFCTAGTDDFIREVEVVINGGTIGGNVYGGSKAVDGNPGKPSIKEDTNVYVTGGTIEGSVYGGGTVGTIGGSTNVTVSGGIIMGNIYGCNATDRLSGNVTVEGNKANIRGNIMADHVTLQNVADGGELYGFGHYINTISARQLTLDNMRVSSFGATLNGISDFEAKNGTVVGLRGGQQIRFESVSLDGSKVAFSSGDGLTKLVTGNLSATGQSVLGANLELSPSASYTLGGALSLAGGELSLSSLAMAGDSWDAWLANGETLTLFRDVSALNLLDEQGDVSKSLGIGDSYTFSDDEVARILGAEVDTETYTLKYARGSLALISKADDGGEAEPTFESVALSHNAAAGAALITEAMESGVPAGGDLASALLAANGMLGRGDTAALNRLMASMAGSSIATMGAAFNADVDRQLRAIRNRTTTMGVDPNQMLEENLPCLNAWVNAEGDYRKLKQDGTAAGYTLDSWGGTLGFDVDISPELSVGAAMTAMYGNITASGPEQAEGDLDTYYASVFARYVHRAWMHTFVATAGGADAELDRTVSYAGGSYKTSGGTSGFGFGLLYELGYVVPLNEDATACLQPVLNVAWRHTSLDGYTERDSDAALQAGEQTMDAVTFGLGARLQAAVAETLYNRTAIAEIRALLKADAGDRRNSLDVAMLYGSRRADIESAELGAMGVELGAGLTVPVGAEGGALFMDASADVRSSYTNFNATVGYRINF